MIGWLFVMVFVLFKMMVLIWCVCLINLLFLNKILFLVVWLVFIIIEVGVVSFNVYG